MDEKKGLLALLEDQNFSSSLSNLAGDLTPSIYDSDVESFAKDLGSSSISGLSVLGLLGTGGVGVGLASASALLSFGLSKSKRKKEKALALKEKKEKLGAIVDQYKKAKKDRQNILDSAGLSQKLANLDSTGLGLKQLDALNTKGTSGLKRNAALRKAQSESAAEQYIFETKRQIKEIGDIIDVANKELTENKDSLDFILKDVFKKEKEDL